MKHILITTIVAVVLVGCAKNNIKLTNKGAKDWQEIAIKAGGEVFEVKQLKGRAAETLRFKPKA